MDKFVVGLLLFFLPALPNFSLAQGAEGKEIFSRNCEICHTVGGGNKVGPDLNGVTTRRSEEWLKSFIQHPAQMFDEKDPVATGLLDQYKIPMPDRGLTDQDVAAIIQYLKSMADLGSTAATEAPKIIKRAASKENINKGRALFQGTERFLRRGPSCTSCHNVKENSFFAGGALAKDLTESYSRLGDAGTASILKNPPFPLMHEAYANKELTNEEISYLKDFLGNVNEEQHKPTDYGSNMLGISMVFLVILFLFFYFIIWAVGK